MDRSRANEDDLLALQSSEGKKELSKEAIEILSNEERKFVFPDNMLTLREGIIVYKALCSVIFGEDSLIVKSLEKWTAHMEDYRQTYNEMIIEKTFPTQIAADIDTNVVAFLNECETKVVLADVNKEFLDWRRSFYELGRNQFSHRLSPEIQRLMMERENKSNKRKSGSNPSQQQQRRRVTAPRTQLPMD